MLLFLSGGATAIAGGFSETYAAMQMAGLLVAGAIFFMDGAELVRRRVLALLAAGFVGSLFSAILLLVAPGNEARIASSFNRPSAPTPGTWLSFAILSFRFTLDSAYRSISSPPALAVFFLPLLLAFRRHDSASDPSAREPQRGPQPCNSIDSRSCRWFVPDLLLSRAERLCCRIYPRRLSSAASPVHHSSICIFLLRLRLDLFSRGFLPRASPVATGARPAISDLGLETDRRSHCGRAFSSPPGRHGALDPPFGPMPPSGISRIDKFGSPSKQGLAKSPCNRYPTPDMMQEAGSSTV